MVSWRTLFCCASLLFSAYNFSHIHTGLWPYCWILQSSCMVSCHKYLVFNYIALTFFFTLCSCLFFCFTACHSVTSSLITHVNCHSFMRFYKHCVIIAIDTLIVNQMCHHPLQQLLLLMNISTTTFLFIQCTSLIWYKTFPMLILPLFRPG